jgi:hypothetical protein
MTANPSNDLPSRIASLSRQLGKPEWSDLLEDRSGSWKLATQLPDALPADKVAIDGAPEREVWELIAYFYLASQRWYDAIALYTSLYYHFINHQASTGVRVHKGMPLVWLAESYLGIGNVPLSKRFLMLTLIEDAIREQGVIDPTGTGSYFRMVWRHGMTDSEFARYAVQAFSIFKNDPANGQYPEYILQELDSDWLVELPTPNDASIYVANPLYIQHLIAQLGEPTGKLLERLAEYLVSCIPGCRTTRRGKGGSTDYDVICSMEGPTLDFRADLGRYFICECKDWKTAADFTVFAKFARVLDSIKASFGILFSSEGITGSKRHEDAWLDQMKVFQDRGMVIVVVSRSDLDLLSKGANFVSMLRRKYEEVRLDLRSPAKPATDGA